MQQKQTAIVFNVALYNVQYDKLFFSSFDFSSVAKLFKLFHNRESERYSSPASESAVELEVYHEQ